VSETRTAIIGAGYSGLSAGYELARQGIPCTLFESAAMAGGLASCFRLGNSWIERFYHHWFNHDCDVLNLIDDLGLRRHLIRRETTTSSFYANKIYRLSSPADVLRFKPLSLPDRIRLGRMALRAKGINDHRPLEGQTAHEWITQHSSAAVYDTVWRPLFEGKFGHYADRVSAVWFWSKLRTRGQSRSRRRHEELLYLDGGLQRLTRAMSAAIAQGGGDIRLRSPVRKIRRVNGAWEVDTHKGSETFDRVLLTTPVPVTLDLLDDLPESYRRRARAIPYLGVTALVLVLNRPLSDAYWINVNDQSYPFVGIIEHTNFQSPEAYDGRHIVYLTKYRDETHETCGMGTTQIFDRWKVHLQRMFPSFEESWVELALSWHSPHAQPVVLAGNESHILPPETPLPGIWTCSMAQVYPEDRGTNYAVKMGQNTAQRMVAATAVKTAPRRIVRVRWPSPVKGNTGEIEPAAALQGLAPA